MDIAYETFLSGDKIVDASFVYMMALMGVAFLAMAAFWIVKYFYSYKECECCEDIVRKKSICPLCNSCIDCCYCQYDAEAKE